MRTTTIAVASVLLVIRAAVAACPEFAPPVNFGGGRIQGNVAVGDVNGDGIADLAVPGDGVVNVLLGDGKGGLAVGRRCPHRRRGGDEPPLLRRPSEPPVRTPAPHRDSDA